MHNMVQSANIKFYHKSLEFSSSANEIRKMRKGARQRPGRVRDQAGTLKSSDERAETFANFLAPTQWAMRPVSCNMSDSLSSTLPVSCLNISSTKVVEAARKLKRGKACGQGSRILEMHLQS